MPAAVMDLTDMLAHDRVAGNELAVVTDTVRQVGGHLLYMHATMRRIHGDLKPRNIVKIWLEDEKRWILIDLDATCDLGEEAGAKVTSSAYFPPEMARRELERHEGRREEQSMLRQLRVDLPRAAWV